MKVLENKIVTREAFVRATSAEMLENRQVEFVISSEAIDSYGTIFRMSGWNLNRYMQNPIVCYQHESHSSDPDNIIGISSLRIEDDKLIGTVTFEDAEINPKAEKIFRKVQNGTLKMASVGARITKYHFGDKAKGENEDVIYFDEAELLEWSIVTLGANPDAYKRNAQTVEELRQALISEMDVNATEIGQTRNVQEAQLLINKNRF